MLTITLFGCSRLLLDPVMVEPELDETTGRPKTKSGTDAPGIIDEAILLHQAQTDHYIMLMHHVEFRDSIYVQTLTEEDMASLGITETERVFSNDYVVSMNEFLKNK